MKKTPIHLNIDYIQNNPNLLRSIIKIQSRSRGILLRKRFKTGNNKVFKPVGDNITPNNKKENQNPKIVLIIFLIFLDWRWISGVMYSIFTVRWWGESKNSSNSELWK